MLQILIQLQETDHFNYSQLSKMYQSSISYHREEIKKEEISLSIMQLRQIEKRRKHLEMRKRLSEMIRKIRMIWPIILYHIEKQDLQVVLNSKMSQNRILQLKKILLKTRLKELTELKMMKQSDKKLILDRIILLYHNLNFVFSK